MTLRPRKKARESVCHSGAGSVDCCVLKHSGEPRRGRSVVGTVEGEFAQRSHCSSRCHADGARVEPASPTKLMQLL